MYPASGILRVLVAASAIAAAGCSRGDGSRADDTRAETTITLGASENPAATASTTPDQKAAEQALDDTLRETEFDDPLTAHCVTARAGAEPDLAEQASDDAWVGELVTSCSTHVVIAREFADNAAEAGDLTQAQVDCLAAGFAALAPEDIEAIVAAGTSPGLVTDEQDAAASKAMTGLLATCTG